MFLNGKVSGLLLLSSIFYGVSCSSDSSKTPAATGNDKTIASAESLSDLQISDKLKLTLPASLANQKKDAASLLLTERKKSYEGCMLRGNVLEAEKSSLEFIKLFSDFEAEGAELGKNYNATITGGDDGDVTMRLGSTKTDSTITIFMCSGDGLKLKASITGLAGDKAKGAVKFSLPMPDMGNLGDDEEGEEEEELELTEDLASFETSFDNVTTDGLHELFSQISMGSFLQATTDIKIVTAGISTIKTASLFGEISFLGAAKLNDEFGATLSVNTLGETQGASKSFFDADGYMVEEADSELFAEGGDLYVSDSDLLSTETIVSTVAFEESEFSCTPDAEDIVLELTTEEEEEVEEYAELEDGVDEYCSDAEYFEAGEDVEVEIDDGDEEEEEEI